MNLTVLLFPSQDPAETKRMKSVLTRGLKDCPHRIISDTAFSGTASQLLFAVPLGPDGINYAYLRFLSQLRQGLIHLKGCVAGMVIQSEADLYGKALGAEFALALSMAGCGLVGHPLIEGILPPTDPFREETDLIFHTESNPMSELLSAIGHLAERIMGPVFRGKSPLTGRPSLPKLLCVHPYFVDGSNAYHLWDELKRRLVPFMQYKELCLSRESTTLCPSCQFHYGKKVDPSSYYGSPLTQETLKDVEEADALLMVVPNIHNSLPAVQLAFIQQLSALCRHKDFSEKAVYALIVSPFSGGDMVAQQLISALSLENSFYLPPNFAMMEVASLPSEILSLPDIELRMDRFSHGVLELLSLGLL